MQSMTRYTLCLNLREMSGALEYGDWPASRFLVIPGQWGVNLLFSFYGEVYTSFVRSSLSDGIVANRKESLIGFWDLIGSYNVSRSPRYLLAKLNWSFNWVCAFHTHGLCEWTCYLCIGLSW